MQNEIDKLQYDLTMMHQENEELRGKDDKAIIKAFKSPNDFEELQIDFDRLYLRLACYTSAASQLPLESRWWIR